MEPEIRNRSSIEITHSTVASARVGWRTHEYKDDPLSIHDLEHAIQNDLYLSAQLLPEPVPESVDKLYDDLKASRDAKRAEQAAARVGAE